MASNPFTDYVNEEYIASLPVLESAEHIPTLKDLEQKYFNTLKPPKHVSRKWHLPVNHPIRLQLWPFLINKYLGTSIEIPSNKDEVGSASLRLEDEDHQPSPEHQSLLAGQEWADRRLLPIYNLNERGRAVHLRVLHDLAVSQPQIVYAPHVWPLAALLLHYLRPRTVIACLRALLDTAADERVAQSKSLWRSRCLALEVLLESRSFAGRPFRLVNFFPIKELRQGKRNTEERQSDVLVAWPIAVWSLPFECLVPMVDCFLVEGIKVLFRIGFVLWKLSMHKAKELKGNEAEEKEDEEGRGAHLLTSIAIGYPAAKSSALLKKAFRVRQLSQKQIDAAVQKAAKQCQASNGGVDIVDNLVMPCVLPGQRTFTAYSQVRAEFKARQVANANIAPSRAIASSLANAEQLNFLMLSVKDENIAQCSVPSVIFSTERDGSSLQTLYRICNLHAKVTGRPQTFLLVSTASGEGLFGAFVTHRWSTECRGFFGSGESFLFRLLPTPAIVYKWNMSSNLQYFQRATEEGLEVGGGLDAGPPGLRLDAELKSGQSGPSPTFSSDCLVIAPTDTINVGHCKNGQGGDGEYCFFNVGTVEVLGFVDPNSTLE